MFTLHSPVYLIDDAPTADAVSCELHSTVAVDAPTTFTVQISAFSEALDAPTTSDSSCEQLKSSALSVAAPATSMSAFVALPSRFSTAAPATSASNVVH